MKLRVIFRDLQAVELADLDWSGGAEHLRDVSAALQASYAGETAVVVGGLGNSRLVALGIVDFRQDPEAGVLRTLAVHHRMQSMGIGTRLVGELERRVVDQHRRWARLTVELDNPGAAALYRRLGYVEVGPALDSWPIAGGQTYVAACTRLERDLKRRRPESG